MKIKTFMRMALMAVMLLISGNALAQEKTSETFNFPKMLDIPNGAWTIDQKLDGETIERRRAGITMAFVKNAGKDGPEFTTCTNHKGDDVQAVCLYPGNTLTITSDTKNIVKIEFNFVAKSKSANGRNYEMTQGDYTGSHPFVWTGKTQNFELKNLNNKGGMQITRMVVHYEDAE